MHPILTVRNLSTGYGKKQVLFNVSLDVMPAEILLITGGNGSGKSTLLKAIYGLLPAWNAEAEITFRCDPNGPPLNTQPPSLNLRNGLAYLPQKNAVFDDLTVEDNLRLAGHTLPNGKEFTTRRNEVLATLPVLPPLLRRKPEKMSGGERQMAALAMVLLHRPRLLLMDEPLAGLDSNNLHLIAGIIRGVHQQRGLALIIVEHRVTEFAALAHRTLHFRLGVIAENMPHPERLGESPIHC
jgi:branched-chain amino acid transport system ATP-binding protein